MKINKGALFESTLSKLLKFKIKKKSLIQTELRIDTKQ